MISSTPDQADAAAAEAEAIQYRQYVSEKIKNGLARAKTEGTVPQAEVACRLAKWLCR